MRQIAESKHNRARKTTYDCPQWHMEGGQEALTRMRTTWHANTSGAGPSGPSGPSGPLSLPTRPTVHALLSCVRFSFFSSN